MKAIILVGGPTPSATGNITTHLYVPRFINRCKLYLQPLSDETGRSQQTGLSFSQSWEGFEPLHAAFVQWLRSAYRK